MIIIDARREKNSNIYPVTANMNGDIKSKNANKLDRQSKILRLVELFGHDNSILWKIPIKIDVAKHAATKKIKNLSIITSYLERNWPMTAVIIIYTTIIINAAITVMKLNRQPAIANIKGDNQTILAITVVITLNIFLDVEPSAQDSSIL